MSSDTPRPSATPTVQVDNERVRVTEWRFAPGEATGWHRHGHDYVVVPMTTGALTLAEPGGGTRRSELKAGVEHDVINDNPFEFVFVEVEMKRG